MSREYEYDFDLREPLECLLLSDSGITHSTERSQKRSRLGQQLGRRLRSTAPAFAMIGLSEVCQLEIGRERFRHLMRLSDIQTIYNFLRTGDQALHIPGIVSRLRVQLS